MVSGNDFHAFETLIALKSSHIKGFRPSLGKETAINRSRNTTLIGPLIASLLRSFAIPNPQRQILNGTKKTNPHFRVFACGFAVGSE